MSAEFYTLKASPHTFPKTWVVITIENDRAGVCIAAPVHKRGPLWGWA